jgi:hypothetical protein
VEAVIQFAPSACAGPLLTRELFELDKALSNPERPLLAIVGGSKVSTSSYSEDTCSPGWQSIFCNNWTATGLPGPAKPTNGPVCLKE